LHQSHADLLLPKVPLHKLLFVKFFVILLLTKVCVSVASSTPEVSRYPEVPKYPPAKRSVRFNSSGTVSMVKGTWQRGGFSGVFEEIGSA
jgi:hypothetical protein